MNKATKQSKIIGTVAIGIATAALMGSCTPVKEYQKSRLNDGEMVLGNRKVEKNGTQFPVVPRGRFGRQCR